MKPNPIKPLRILITAGPTREYLDPVRYLSNDSSGRMGFALAAAARRRGHAVALVHGPVSLRSPAGVEPIPVVSAAEMLAACRKLWRRADVLIMAAAVADYTPAERAATKRRKEDRPLVLRLAPTVDILATLSARRRRGQRVIGFALQDRAPRANAERKLRDKGLDAIVLNRPAAIGRPDSAVEVLVRGETWQKWPAAAKSRHATRLIRLVERLYERRASH